MQELRIPLNMFQDLSDPEWYAFTVQRKVQDVYPVFSPLLTSVSLLANVYHDR